MKLFVSAITLFSILNASAAIQKFAEPKADAPKGGNFVRSLGGEPPTIHPIMATDAYSTRVQDYVLDTLLDRKATDWDWVPRLAASYEIAKDGKSFTFKIRENATWHDGKPVTAEDVKFSFEAIFEPKFQAQHMIPYYSGIQGVEVVDNKTVKVTTKEVYYKNFDAFATMQIVPKHIHQDIEKSKKMTRTLIGSGPYKLEKFDRGQKILLKRNPNWAAANEPYYKGAYNFDTVDLRFYKDENIEIERMKKGELDIIDMGSEAYEKKTVGAPWGTKVFKKKVQNDAPKAYNFIGWNLRKELFQDKKVRVALAHLMNREEINKKFMYGNSDLVKGPTYNTSEFVSEKVKPLLFDPKKAQELLKEAGWTDSDKDGTLDKTVNGKKTNFTFSLIYPNKDTEKYWTLYQQDLKKAGIQLELKYMEWNSFLKLLDDGNFDASALAWMASDVDWDPKQIWHSSSAVVGGSNFVHYKNAEVDKLIDQARGTIDKTKRVATLKKVYETIADDAPYLFLFSSKFTFYGHSKAMGMPGDTMRYSAGLPFWWRQAP